MKTHKYLTNQVCYTSKIDAVTFARLIFTGRKRKHLSWPLSVHKCLRQHVDFQPLCSVSHSVHHSFERALLYRTYLYRKLDGAWRCVYSVWSGHNLHVRHGFSELEVADSALYTCGQRIQAENIHSKMSFETYEKYMMGQVLQSRLYGQTEPKNSRLCERNRSRTSVIKNMAIFFVSFLFRTFLSVIVYDSELKKNMNVR